MKIKIIYILFPFLCIGCNNASSKHEMAKKSQNLKDKIVIILDSVPDTRVKTFDHNGAIFSLRNMCSYINDDNEEMSFLYPDRFNVNDTIEINTRRGSVIFNVSFLGGLSTVGFLLKTNNSYHIGYNDTVPYMKNIKSYEHINTYYQTLYHDVFDDKISGDWRLNGFGPMFFVIGKGIFPTQEEIDNALPAIFKKVEDEIDWQVNYIDSLHQSDKIDNDQYRLLKSVVDLKKYTVNQNIEKNKYLRSFKNRYKADWAFKISNDLLSDSDVYFNPYTYDILYRYNDLDSFYNDDKNNSVILMHKALDERAINSKLNKTLLSRFLDRIFAETNWDIIKKNSVHYLSIYPESKLPDFLMSKYNIDTTKVNDVVLQDINGQETTLSDVLKKLHGKKVVLDVWASWCAPCIHKIKTGKNERDKGKEQGIEYVFITYFDNKSAWLKEIETLDLKKEKHCYFTTNSKTSRWFKDMKINAIPCIITYDETGKVVGLEK